MDGFSNLVFIGALKDPHGDTKTLKMSPLTLNDHSIFHYIFVDGALCRVWNVLVYVLLYCEI